MAISGNTVLIIGSFYTGEGFFYFFDQGSDQRSEKAVFCFIAGIDGADGNICGGSYFSKRCFFISVEQKFGLCSIDDALIQVMIFICHN